MLRSLTALLGLLALSAPALAGTLRVDVLDIGQGDSILIRSPGGKTILIDAGDGKVDVPPILAREGVTSLDLVIGTHPHADHIGGMDDVVAGFPIKVYTDNGLPHTTATYARLMSAIEAKGIAYRAAVSGQTYNLDDGAKLEVLFPNGTKLTNTRSDLNSNSVVARLTHQGHCMLFVGDAEEPTEDALVAAGLGPCDVLKVAHHGSRHSSSQRFLDALRPKHAVISVGVGNRYHHPGRETIQKLVAMKVDVHRTDLEGQLTILSSEKGLTVKGAHAPLLAVTATPEETEAALGKPGASRAEARAAGGDGMDDTAEGARVGATAVRATPARPPAAATQASVGSGVDLNTATLDELIALPEIGPRTAEKILAYRAERGGFTNVEELLDVKGIGPKTMDAVRPLVRVGARPAKGNP
jgi:competence protein ComEC